MPNEAETTPDFLDGVLDGAGFDDEQPQQTASPNGQQQQFDMPAFLARHGVRVKSINHDGKCGMKYILEECPFDSNHKAPDSFVAVMPSGALCFHCSHNSCSGYKWQAFRERFEPGYRNKPQPQHTNQQKADTSRGDALEFETITLAQLKDAPEPEYFIPGILETSQCGVIAGQYKSLKTTLAVELSYCLATGADFLGSFTPNRTARVGMFSGESGPSQLRSMVQRIARFHGDHSPWKHDGLIFSCERLPRIGDIRHMDALARWIDRNHLEVAIIDPGYAALAAIGDGAGNYYKVAELLFQVTALHKKTGCVILLCPHACKAPKYDPPMLSDIQWSGFSEWSGTWLLSGKRREWDDQTGQHWLWLVSGGRSGHAATYGLDVREGRQADVGGKVFEPSIVDKGAAFRATIDAQAEQKQRQQTREEERSAQAIRDAFRAMGSGCHLKTHVIERTGKSGKGKAVQAAWAEMLRRKEIAATDGACRGPNNKPETGYSWNPPQV